MTRSALPSRQAHRPARGVSLVEAIVAMAVMAFGMMAIVGLQSSLRLNSDIARQRAEAVRIAEDAIEAWRAFALIGSAGGGGPAAYDDIPVGVQPDVVVPAADFNTTFTLKRTVVDRPGWKSVSVQVTWTDRAGVQQSVQLGTIIARSDPALSGVLSVAAADGLAGLPPGRHPAVPRGAVPVAQDGSKSAYKPPGAPADTVLLFDNLTGVVTSVCTFPGDNVSELVPAVNCVERPSWPISGFVRFSYGPFPSGNRPVGEQIPIGMFALAAGVEHGDGQCFVAPVQDPKLTFTSYMCIVPQSADTTWSGRILLGPPLDLDLFDVCRYSNGEPGNENHPRVYVEVSRPLTDQNFLVVDEAIACPSGTLPLQPPELLPPPGP